MDMKLWQHQTFYNSNDASKNFLDFHVYDLTDVKLGRFIIGIQTTVEFQKFASIKNIIRESVERFGVIAKPLTVSEGLEKLYAYINKYSREVLEPKEYSQLHVAIIYIKDDEMHFSIQGDLKLILIRKNHIFDVVKMTYGLSPHNYDKLFGRMYSGSVNEEDHLILTSFETWDCFDTQKLSQIVAKLSADGAVGFLTNYLPEHSPYKLGGLLVNLSAAEKNGVDLGKNNLSPADSLKELINTEEKTSEWISPSPKQKVLSTVATIKMIIGKYAKAIRINKKNTARNSVNKLQPIQHQKVTQPRPESQKIIRNKPTYAKRLKIKNLFKTIAELPRTVNYFFSRGKRLYTKWPRSTKYLLIIAIVLIVVLSQSVSYTNKRNNTREQVTFFNQQIEEIEQKHTQANQAIIFKDYSRARTLLISGSNSIASLPSQSEDQQNEKQRLQDTNQQLLNRANRQTLITKPNVIANFATKNPTSITDLNINDDTLLVVTSDEVISIKPGEEPVVIALSENLNDIHATALEDPPETDSELIVLYNNNFISSINPSTGTVTPMNTTVNHNGAVGATIYTNRLYVVNKDSEQIIRFRQGSASFQAGSSWLEIPSELSNARDIAVDGDVYVLEGKEEIMQFNQGARTSWRSEKLDPGLENATKLTTNTNSDYLYILDPNNKRFLVYDKKGNFIQQFTSPTFDNLIDMVVVENRSNITAYILNGTSIISVPFELK